MIDENKDGDESWIVFSGAWCIQFEWSAFLFRSKNAIFLYISLFGFIATGRHSTQQMNCPMFFIGG